MNDVWLSRALEESRARGFVGPGPLDTQLAHAEGFARAWEHERAEQPTRFVDLGTGGGLPGFVLLRLWSGPGVLLDGMIRRTSFLEEALTWEGAPSNGTVVTGRAEEVARHLDQEGQYDLVVARSFGAPAVVAECAVRFLAPDGLLIVSEPPRDDQAPSRWPIDSLAELGLAVGARVSGVFGFQILRRTGPLSERFPRRTGIPAKRPLF